MDSDIIGKAFFRNFYALYLQRGNALSQYHFQKSFFFKNAEFKFAFCRVYKRYSIMGFFFLTSFEIQNNWTVMSKSKNDVVKKF